MRQLTWLDPKIKQTKRVLTNITLHKARAVYHWEVGADTKLYPDSDLGNSLGTASTPSQ